MITTREKAKRYDAIQSALKFHIDTYSQRKREALNRYRDTDVIGAYNKGMADAYRDMLQTLRCLKD